MFEIFPGVPKKVNGVSLEELEDATSFAKRLEMCKKLRRLGAGSARRVFQWTPRFVLKVAKNRKGLAQNRVESDYFVNRSYEVIARTFLNADEDTFIVAEAAKRINSARFQVLMGLSFKDFCRYVRRRIWKLEPSIYEQYVQQFGEAVVDYVEEFLDLGVTVDLAPGDLTRLSSYGEVHGRVVLVDWGATNDVIHQFYS